MKSINIEQVPALLAAGKISEKEANDAVWIELYTKPGKYGLRCMNEDVRSDFILHMRDAFVTLCKKYDKNSIPFSQFLKGVLFHHKFVYLNRKKFKTEVENELEKYLISDVEEKYEEDSPIKSFEKAAPSVVYHKLTAKRRLITETSLLILAMKFCHDMDDSLLSHISAYTKIPKPRLDELIVRMKKQTEKKRNKYNTLIKRRDNSFFLHARYALQLKKNNYSEEKKAHIRSKLEKHTRLWQRHNKRLSTRFISSPSNQEISEELGIKARQVSFYIDHIMKNKDKIFEKESDLFVQTEADTSDAIKTENEEGPAFKKSPLSSGLSSKKEAVSSWTKNRTESMIQV